MLVANFPRAAQLVLGFMLLETSPHYDWVLGAQGTPRLLRVIARQQGKPFALSLLGLY